MKAVARSQTVVETIFFISLLSIDVWMENY